MAPETGQHDGESNQNTVFIDTSLDTHLATIISDSDTVSDLKTNLLNPNIRVIRANPPVVTFFKRLCLHLVGGSWGVFKQQLEHPNFFAGAVKRILLLWTLEPTERDAYLAHEATKKSTASNWVLMEIACTRSSQHLICVRKAYHAKYKKSIEEDVAHHTSGGYRKKHNGYPSGSMVDFACDAYGSPILAVNSLAVHTKVFKHE